MLAGNLHQEQPVSEESTSNESALQKIGDVILETNRERLEAERLGIDALKRLFPLACQDTGQGRTVRLFLLGLFDSSAWPMEMNRLRGLDMGIQRDVLAVLRMDMSARCDIEARIKTEKDFFHVFCQMEKPASECCAEITECRAR